LSYSRASREERAFYQAEAFRWAGQQPAMGEAFEQNMNVGNVAQVCLAFALELYLKILIGIQLGKPPQTHSLVELFGRLNPPTQARVRQRFQAVPRRPEMVAMLAAAGAPSDFDGMLKVSNDAFVRARYAYENVNTPPGKGWMGNEIMEAVRQLILEAHPVWGTRTPAPKKVAL
jgi:hypothetical protein